MRKLITIIFILASFGLFAQMSVIGDTIEITGGGSFGGTVDIGGSVIIGSTGEIIAVSDSAVDAATIYAYLNVIKNSSFIAFDGSNISRVGFLLADSTWVYYSIAHAHLEYLLVTQLSDIAYNATTWNGNLDAATKNAIRDKIEALGVGSVTSVSAGNGMDFSTITGSGSVTMGTPTTLTAATTNAVTSTGHTHDVTGFAELQTMTDNAIFRANLTAGEYQNSGVIIDDNDDITGINILTADSIHAVWFGGSDFTLSESGSLIINNSDSTTLTTSPSVQVGSNAIVSGDEIVSYVVATVSSIVKDTTVTLSAGQVADLGTAKILVAAPGVTEIIQIIEVTWLIDVATQLEVGVQTLGLKWENSTNNLLFISNASIESAADLINQVSGRSAVNTNLKSADAFICILSTPANPSSGSATMTFYITYRIITL